MNGHTPSVSFLNLKLGQYGVTRSLEWKGYYEDGFYDLEKNYSVTCLLGLLWRGAVVLTESALETLLVIFVPSQKSVAWRLT